MRVAILALAALTTSGVPNALAQERVLGGLRGPLGLAAAPVTAPGGTDEAAPSGPHVQFGIFTSRSVADERWLEIRRAYGKDMTGRSLMIRRQVFRGRAAYRSSVVGFQSQEEALSFCTKLRRGGFDCVVRL